jgi:NTP-dependent ternary system trypsin peptidase co-occuring protein
MKRLIEFPTEDGGSLLVEVDDDSRLGAGSTLRGGPGSMVIEKARVTYEEALDKIKGAAETIIIKMKELPHSPDEITVEFGIKLTADIGAILASTSTEAQFTLRLTWKPHVLSVVEVAPTAHEDEQPSPQDEVAAGDQHA